MRISTKAVLAVLFFCCLRLFAGQVKLGDEVLVETGFRALKGKRVGLLTNPSGVNRRLESTLDVLRNSSSVKLVALFGAEHGVYGDVNAGGRVDNTTDARTGLPVFSLYGKTRKPTPEMLKGIDALVYDLQDTGSRGYTFISSMGEAMEGCGEAGKEFVVLDRPDPLGGERVEGPMVEQGFRSFVSRWDVPFVYGLTCGELARMIAGEKWIPHPPKLTVVPLKSWKRSMVWSDTGLPWVPASPHVPHADSALFLAATGTMGELGGINTGVGYTLPFECIAAPGLDGYALAAALNGYHLPGVLFKPTTYRPYYFSYTNQAIAGVQIYLTNPHTAPLTALNFYALEALKKACGLDVLAEAGQGKRGYGMFDKVNGTDAVRKALQAGTPVSEIVASWKAGEESFRKARKPYLLY